MKSTSDRIYKENITWSADLGKKVSVILKTSKATEFEVTFLQQVNSNQYGLPWSDIIQVRIVERFKLYIHARTHAHTHTHTLTHVYEVGQMSML
jgi:hypothetical protein